MNPPCPDDVILEDLVTNIVFYICQSGEHGCTLRLLGSFQDRILEL